MTQPYSNRVDEYRLHSVHPLNPSVLVQDDHGRENRAKNEHCARCAHHAMHAIHESRENRVQGAMGESCETHVHRGRDGCLLNGGRTGYGVAEAGMGA